jgi:predicted ribosomally synthesized peptide with nif11-like leader
MNEEKIKELFTDEAFIASIAELETAEDVQKALSEKGLDLSIEEITAIQNALASNDGELSEDDLENVAGGSGFNLLTLYPDSIKYLNKTISGAINKSMRKHNW